MMCRKINPAPRLMMMYRFYITVHNITKAQLEAMGIEEQVFEEFVSALPDHTTYELTDSTGIFVVSACRFNLLVEESIFPCQSL